MKAPRLPARTVGITAGLAVAGVLAATGLAGRASADGSTPWPELNDPPHSNVEWVAQDVRINGVPSRIEHFDSELSPAEVLAHYRAHWARTDGAKPLREPRLLQQGGWQTLSTQHGPFQLVVQVKPHAPQGSEGLISVANFGDVRSDFVPRDLPRLDHADVVQVTESLDAAQKSAYVSLVSDQGFDANLRRYADAWTRRGWSPTAAQTKTGEGGVEMHYASYVRDGETLDQSFTWRPDDRRTYMTVNLVSAAAPKEMR